MKLKKLPGFSLGLIALAVGNAYATQLLDEHNCLFSTMNLNMLLK